MREYMGVVILPKNYCGMYSARVPSSDGGIRLAADTLDGIKYAIREALKKR